MTQDEASAIHSRLDELFTKMGEIGETVARIDARCPPCQQNVAKHESTLYGNGKEGLVTKIATLESGKVDTLSVKSFGLILGAVGSLCAAIAAAVAGVINAVAKG